VGFKMENAPAAAPKDGSPIVDKRIRGYVCTARLSVALKEVVGLALVDDELAAEGSRLSIYEDGCQGQLINAKVVKKPFYDPQGDRLRM
jgi:sarcosine oxidase subunit alpha